ncbi:capsular polysaccharide biosynthesis protein [Variovorax sp. J22P271]|uniref:capsular polysaccharide biosynthesis protein n=1 Tax=Variovorax davisae TaxID=3053515 RepID=UPI002577E7EC|nr:capsular polysaccharide biosynthesis protein [Variovorax sp. J22P271]MDM0034578.1 capsular polysaccharide biosynthesis protein [Variovorax sp. J22P271]
MSRGIRAIATLPALLSDTELLFGALARSGEAEAVLAWGRKRSAAEARRFAESRGLPTLQIEDGFLRSVGLGSSDPPLSLVLDDLGIYYDAGSASRLERLIAMGCPARAQTRTAVLVESWRTARVSKYNHARERVPESMAPAVLVIDQTRGDESILFGQADAHSFAQMLDAALDEHPAHLVLIKTHPDVIAGRKRGHFDRLTPGQAARVKLWASDAHPPSLLERAECVYTVTSQMGFEAILWGKALRCFGMPFYAGWGLSQDVLQPPVRRRPASLHDLVHATLVQYPRYLDPESGRRCEVERAIEHFALQRRMRERFAPVVHALRFSHWKKPIVRAYFGGSKVRFVNQVAKLPAGATVAVWGQREVPAATHAAEIVRLEDGFLRSVGLGADLVKPLSWVLDRSGLYYDSSRSSELESICETASFDARLLARARALRERIVAQRITKYNVGKGEWTRPSGKARVVLVVGQVEADASIAFGARSVQSNLGLLRAARSAAPDAYIVYKPHPDVVARLRRAGVDESGVDAICDESVPHVPIDLLFEAVEEVHVLTSLAGFEALLRGLRVVVHGQPFYASWGLTEDREPVQRRRRRLTLDELVAASLILYPRYVSLATGLFTTPERALDELSAWRERGASRLPPWRRAWRAVKRATLRSSAWVRG